jgi:hypothetical protein
MGQKRKNSIDPVKCFGVLELEEIATVEKWINVL